MDCKTARLLIDLAGFRQTSDFDAAELRAFHTHLDECPDCAVLARSERAIDDRLTRAMRAVPLPEGLHDRLLAGLAVEATSRGRRPLRWFGGAAAAAVVLAASLGWWGHHKPVHLDVDAAAATVAAQLVNPSPELVDDWLRSHGFASVAVPRDFNFALLTYCGTEELQGQRVPMLLFTTPGNEHARVYLLSTRQFDLAEAQNQPVDVSVGCRAEVRPDADDPRSGSLVIFTGESLQPFLQRPSSL
jgi:hypothetical protein